MDKTKINLLEKSLRSSGDKTIVLERDRFGRPLISLNLVTESGRFEIHDKTHDLIHVLSGYGSLEMGGTILDRTLRSIGEWRGTKSTGQKRNRIAQGDIIPIKAGIPHRIIVPKGGTILFMAVKNYIEDFTDFQKLDDKLSIKFRRIKGLLMDVDGTMTDGKVLINDKGEEFASFSRIDSWGLKQLQEAGFLLGMISFEKISIAQSRGKKLNIPVFNDIKDKVAQANEIINNWGISMEEVCFIGDDVNDIPLLEKVGLSVCPMDARPQVVSTVDVVIPKRMGENVIRELADLLIAAQA